MSTICPRCLGSHSQQPCPYCAQQNQLGVTQQAASTWHQLQQASNTYQNLGQMAAQAQAIQQMNQRYQFPSYTIEAADLLDLISCLSDDKMVQAATSKNEVIRTMVKNEYNKRKEKVE